jgi:thiamine-monophosphate kinase
MFSGQLGDASYGLKIIEKKTVTAGNQLLLDKFLYPNPRVGEAKIISAFASSMIDLSDGLYSDLMKIMSRVVLVPKLMSQNYLSQLCYQTN